MTHHDVVEFRHDLFFIVSACFYDHPESLPFFFRDGAVVIYIDSVEKLFGAYARESSLEMVDRLVLIDDFRMVNIKAVKNFLTLFLALF